MYKCYICKEHKEASEFHKDRTRASGLMSKCVDCHRVSLKQKRSTALGKAQRVILSRKWKRDNKIKENAHKKVARAVKGGALLKPNHCSNCNSTEHIEGHHPDYTKPLDVIWWCRQCHLNHHRSLNATR